MNGQLGRFFAISYKWDNFCDVFVFQQSNPLLKRDLLQTKRNKLFSFRVDPFPSGHTTLKWRRINVDATWSRRMDVDTTSFWCCVPAGLTNMCYKCLFQGDNDMLCNVSKQVTSRFEDIEAKNLFKQHVNLPILYQLQSDICMGIYTRINGSHMFFFFFFHALTFAGPRGSCLNTRPHPECSVYLVPFKINYKL